MLAECLDRYIYKSKPDSREIEYIRHLLYFFCINSTVTQWLNAQRASSVPPEPTYKSREEDLTTLSAIIDIIVICSDTLITNSPQILQPTFFQVLTEILIKAVSFQLLSSLPRVVLFWIDLLNMQSSSDFLAEIEKLKVGQRLLERIYHQLVDEGTITIDQDRNEDESSLSYDVDFFRKTISPVILAAAKSLRMDSSTVMNMLENLVSTPSISVSSTTPSFILELANFSKQAPSSNARLSLKYFACRRGIEQCHCANSEARYCSTTL